MICWAQEGVSCSMEGGAGEGGASTGKDVGAGVGVEVPAATGAGQLKAQERPPLTSMAGEEGDARAAERGAVSDALSGGQGDLGKAGVGRGGLGEEAFCVVCGHDEQRAAAVVVAAKRAAAAGSSGLDQRAAAVAAAAGSSGLDLQALVLQQLPGVDAELAQLVQAALAGSGEGLGAEVGGGGLGLGGSEVGGDAVVEALQGNIKGCLDELLQLVLKDQGIGPQEGR